MRGFPLLPLRSVLRFSQPLDVFLRSPACKFVSTCYHVQDHFLFRGFSLRAAVLSFSSEAATPLPLSAPRSFSFPNVHGSAASTSRFFSARSSVSISSAFLGLFLSFAPLFRFRAPPGLSLFAVGAGYPASSAPGVAPVRFAFRASYGTSSSASALR